MSETGDRRRTDGGATDSTRWASLGIATYLVLGLGTTITVYLLGVIGGALSSSPTGSVLPGAGGMLSTGALSGAIVIGLLVVAFLGAGVATALGLLAGRNAGPRDSAATNGAMAGGAGVLVTTLVMIVLLLLLGDSGGGGGGDILGLVGMLVGLTLGVAITGAVAAGVGERSATW